jgi:3-deoxy-7-phosphoheptulonate synthase
MFRRTDDLRIRDVRPLIPPAILLEELPISERASNIVADARALEYAGRPSTYGQSITDSCISIDETEQVLERLARAQQARG